MTRWLAVVSVVLCSSLLRVGSAADGPIKPGDLLIADPAGFSCGGTGQLILVDPGTGAQTVVASGGIFIDPAGVAVAPNGDLLVVDPNLGMGAIIRVNPVTGAQKVVASGGNFVDPFGLVVAPNGALFVVDAEAFGGGGGVIQVNTRTGAQTVIASGGYFTDPFGVDDRVVDPLGLALAPNEDLFVAIRIIASVPTSPDFGRVIRVDPVTGAQTVVASGGYFDGSSGTPSGGIAVALTGDLFVAVGGQVVRVDPGTGAQTVVASGGSLVSPRGIAVEPTGDLLVVDAEAFGGGGGVIRVNPETGIQTVVASGGNLVDPMGLAVVAPARRQ